MRAASGVSRAARRPARAGRARSRIPRRERRGGRRARDLCADDDDVAARADGRAGAFAARPAAPTSPSQHAVGRLAPACAAGARAGGQPDLLLLDEPTNHLDIESMTWLETFLPTIAGAVLFVTHDRVFLQRLATRIVELDRGRLTSWPATTPTFLRKKEEWLANEALQPARSSTRGWPRRKSGCARASRRGARGTKGACARCWRCAQERAARRDAVGHGAAAGRARRAAPARWCSRPRASSKSYGGRPSSRLLHAHHARRSRRAHRAERRRARRRCCGC